MHRICGVSLAHMLDTVAARRYVLYMFAQCVRVRHSLLGGYLVFFFRPKWVQKRYLHASHRGVTHALDTCTMLFYSSLQILAWLRLQMGSKRAWNISRFELFLYVFGIPIYIVSKIYGRRNGIAGQAQIYFWLICFGLQIFKLHYSGSI